MYTCMRVSLSASQVCKYPERPAEGMGSPGAGVTDSCE